MKHFLTYIMFLASVGFSQPVNLTGYKIVNRSPVFWGPDSVVEKTRLLLYSDSVFLDTTATGQTATATPPGDSGSVGWLNITGQCSKPFLLASDSNGSVRAGKFRLWHIVRADTGVADSAIYGYRVQTREKVYNATLKKVVNTPWTNADGFNLGSGEGEYRDIFFIQRYPRLGAKFSHWTTAYLRGSVARLCPDLSISGGLDTTPGIVDDSLAVYGE